MFDRMVNYHGLKNMIWVWTTDTKSDNLDWYPGDAYVDILGVDIYAEKGDLSSQILQFNKVRDDFKGKKMVALSENGIIPKVDNLIEDKAYWSWFMVWYGDFVEDGIKNSLISWQNVMNHEYVVTLDEMPLLSKYLGVSPAKLVSENGKFKLALNKRNKSLTIEYNEINKPFNAFMFDLNGRLLQSAENKQESVRFPLNDFKPGIYIIKLIYGNDVETVKIAF
jgi:mannan endo-1,4-beta-mannosidase